MSQPHDFSRVFSYYQEFLSHDEDARKVSWRAVYDQELRFENLLEVLDDSVTSYSLLDVGCGLGDLLGYLRRTGRDAVQYTGVDIVPEMITGARRRYPEHDGRFVCADLLREDLGKFDLVVCSGGLTVRVPKQEAFVREMIAAMVNCSKLAVSFNVLNQRYFRVLPSARYDEDLYYADPLELYSYCRDLVRWTTLREDMLMSDATFYLYTGYARSNDRYQKRADPDPFGAAWLLLERRLPAQALEVLEGASETAPNLNLIGVAHRQLGDRRLARRFYRKALAVDKNYEPARLNLESL